jgi:PadR family transcriptional regulator, regulatory protein PadR
MLTYTSVLVAKELLKNPYARHWGTEVRKATGINSGTLYPMLARMRAEGWLKDSVGQEDTGQGGPPRRYYVLTDSGILALHEHVRQWESRMKEYNVS